MHRIILVALAGLLVAASSATAEKILIYMDLKQTDHLKAYGVVYWSLKQGTPAEWLLNYRGGSFLLDGRSSVQDECRVRGVAFTVLADAEAAEVYRVVEENNMERVLLEKAPNIAIYSPPNKQPWDDAVTMALTYAEVPYTIIWDKEVLWGELAKYDWLHLHHEDFSGQYGKFYGSFRNAPWYVEEKRVAEKLAGDVGYASVSDEKKAVARMIKEFVLRGGFLFAMCSACDTIDIALAGEGVDIVDVPFDNTPCDPAFQSKLNYAKCMAFTGFTLITDPFVYEFSDIDVTPQAARGAPGGANDYFTLFEFSAKYDPVPTMLTQDHVNVVRGFMGQTTAFRKQRIKKSVVVMGEKEGAGEVKYLHGNLGKGTFTFFGGHDPEDYAHMVGDPPTELALHKNSPGYRLILNNILFPAAQKKKRKT
jgi:hypothetical protein